MSGTQPNGNGAGTAVATTEASRDVMPGFGSLQSFELVQRAAKLLAQSSLVPKEYQNNIPNCVIALNMSTRMGADPLMVMQNLYVVHGRPGFSSQFLISTFNTAGRFTALRYEWVGKEGTDDWGCRAWAFERETGEKLTGATVTIKIAKAEGWYSRNGSKWTTMPQQMLMYRAASWFIRTHAPELGMGMHTAEELADTIELSPEEYEVKTDRDAKQNANVQTIDIENDAPKEAPADPDKTEGESSQEEAQPGESGQASLGPGF